MAINYITKKEDYLILQKECKVIFKTEKEFPENLFQPNYIYKLFFENSVEDTQEFYNLLIKFVKKIRDKRVVFFNIIYNASDPRSMGFTLNWRVYLI